MTHVSAFPTVQWLETRKPDRPANDRLSNARRPSAQTPGYRLGKLIERITAPGVRVATDTWVSTPNGDQDVDVLVSSQGRRVALVITGRYEHRSAETDAIRLVYGRADVLLRLRGTVSHEALHGLLLALVGEKPGWFTAAGRVKAGRWASPRTTIALSMAPVDRCVDGVPFWHLGDSRVSRMRMRCASDWVRPFEAALGFCLSRPLR